MSGTIPLSMTQQFDVYGQPLSGGQLTIMQAGTVATPQNPYQDAALALPMSNPITLDAAGRIPQFFLADGYIKIRLADKYGVTQLAADGILVIGPSAGGGGGGGVDPTTIWATGDVKTRYDNAVIAGFVRLNAKTIGSAASGATELADVTAQALFNYLWAKDSTLPVIPSRGASAAADWSANRQITLPDFRGYALGGLDDMGNTAAGRLTASFFGTAATVLGAAGGSDHRTLDPTQMPSHAHGAFINDPGHSHSLVGLTQSLPAGAGAPINVARVGAGTDATINTDIRTTGIHVWDLTTNDRTSAAGGGAAFSTVTPTKLLTIYMKL